MSAGSAAFRSFKDAVGGKTCLSLPLLWWIFFFSSVHFFGHQRKTFSFHYAGLDSKSCLCCWCFRLLKDVLLSNSIKVALENTEYVNDSGRYFFWIWPVMMNTKNTPVAWFLSLQLMNYFRHKAVDVVRKLSEDDGLGPCQKIMTLNKMIKGNTSIHFTTLYSATAYIDGTLFEWHALPRMKKSACSFPSFKLWSLLGGQLLLAQGARLTSWGTKWKLIRMKCPQRKVWAPPHQSSRETREGLCQKSKVKVGL